MVARDPEVACRCSPRCATCRIPRSGGGWGHCQANNQLYNCRRNWNNSVLIAETDEYRDWSKAQVFDEEGENVPFEEEPRGPRLQFETRARFRMNGGPEHAFPDLPTKAMPPTAGKPEESGPENIFEFHMTPPEPADESAEGESDIATADEGIAGNETPDEEASDGENAGDETADEEATDGENAGDETPDEEALDGENAGDETPDEEAPDGENAGNATPGLGNGGNPGQGLGRGRPLRDSLSPELSGGRSSMRGAGAARNSAGG